MICCVCGADTHGRGVRVTYDGASAFPTIYQFCELHYEEHDKASIPSAPLPETPPDIALGARRQALDSVSDIVDEVIKAERAKFKRWMETEYLEIKGKNLYDI